MSKQDLDIARLRVKLDATRNVLATLIAWMAQSAGSPISPSEARTLLKKIDDSSEDA